MADKSRRVAQTEDLSNVEFETSEDVEVIPTFDNMGLRDELLRGIYAYGTSFIILFINLILAFVRLILFRLNRRNTLEMSPELSFASLYPCLISNKQCTQEVYFLCLH